MLADAHRAPRIGGKGPTQLQIQQRRVGRCDVLADVALGFQGKVARYIQHRAGQCTGQVAFHAELRGTAHIQCCNRQIIGRMQVGSTTCPGSQAAAGSYVQRRGLLDADGSNRSGLQLRFAHRPQFVDGDDLTGMTNQLHVAWRGRHCERQRFLLVEVAREDACVVHVHAFGQTAQVIARYQLDIAAGDGGLGHRTAGGLCRLQCTGADREAQLVVIPLGASGKLAIGVRAGIKHEVEASVTGLERRLRVPASAVQLRKLRRHFFGQAGDVGQYLRITLRRTSGHDGPCPERLDRTRIGDERAAHERAVTLQIPVLGIPDFHLALIGRHRGCHTATVQLEAGADIGDLALGQCIGVVTLRCIEQ